LYVNTALSLVVILAGALVRGSGATLACRDWPLCNGVLWPFDQGQLQTVHMVHRLAVVGLGITLLLLLFYVWRDRADSIMRPLTVATLVAYLSQVGVGALFVLSLSAPDWGVAHVGLASVIWGLLVGLSTVETLNNWVVSKDRGETGWISQSDPTGKS
jgi:cytochrome c oxidase assembly protein subunit 15